jgi:transcriptional regulator with XRE-family HTH domain
VAEPVDVVVLGERLKRMRKAREVTLKDVGERTEISIATLSRIERGDAKSVDSATLLALAKWMGADASEFVERPDLDSGKSEADQNTTPDVVELHLRADKNLDKTTAIALAKMFRAAYESLAQEPRRDKVKG